MSRATAPGRAVAPVRDEEEGGGEEEEEEEILLYCWLQRQRGRSSCLLTTCRDWGNRGVQTPRRREVSIGDWEAHLERLSDACSSVHATA